MAGGLGEAHVPGNDGGVHLAGEVALDLLRHLEGQVGAAVKHGEQHALHGQLGVQAPLHQADGGQQVAEALQGVVLALDGDQQGPGGAQGVDSEQLQGGGAVNEDIVVVGGQPLQGIFQQVFPVGNGDHLNTRPGQGLVGGEHVPVLGGDHRFLRLRSVDENVVHVGGGGVLVHPHARGGVGLGIEVAQQGALPNGPQGRGDVDGGGGLAHPALLVDDGNDACCHRVPPLKRDHPIAAL